MNKIYNYKFVNSVKIPVEILTELKDDGVCITFKNSVEDYHFNYYNNYRRKTRQSILDKKVKKLFNILTKIMYEHQEYNWSQISIMLDKNKRLLSPNIIKENIKREKYKPIRSNGVIDNREGKRISIIEHPYILENSNDQFIKMVLSS